MSQSSAGHARSFQLPIQASPTALATPSDIRPVEIWLSSSADILVRATGDSVDITLPTGSLHKLPINIPGRLSITNTAVVNVLVFGNKVVP